MEKKKVKKSRKREKVSFLDNVRMYFRCKSDMKYLKSTLDEDGKPDKSKLQNINRDYFYGKVKRTNKYKFWGCNRKRVSDLIKLVIIHYPYIVNQHIIECDKIVNDWLENGVKNEEVEIGKYYKVVSPIEISKSYDGKLDYSESYYENGLTPYIIKISEMRSLTRYVSDLESIDLGIWYFHGVTRHTVDETQTVYASQLSKEKVTQEEIDQFEMDRRSYILEKIRGKVNGLEVDKQTYMDAYHQIQNDLHDKKWNPIPTVSPKSNNYFNISQSI